MKSTGRPTIVYRAKELLWVIARCDVENLQTQRNTALQHLRDLEQRAAELSIPDLYREVIHSD